MGTTARRTRASCWRASCERYVASRARIVKPFADHFSQIAASYAAYRPHYPDALFAWLASITPDRERAWDCATGSGQAAVALSRHFAHVIATDPSTAQIASAERVARVDYAAMTAERPALAAGSVVLVTVA